MTKQWMLGLITSLLLSTALSAQQGFIAGTDYQLIEPAVKTSNPDKVVVTEMFWYGCPHCFRFEPYVEKWAANLPDGVVFEQVPSVLNANWSDHARTYYTLKLMGELEQHGDNSIHRKLFDAIHIKRKRLNKADTIAKFMGEQGVDENRFRQTYSSFQVDALLRKNMQNERKYGHNGVPAVIVNGKYLTSASTVGSNERLIQVIDYLVAGELSQ
ncbi:MAG: thiol:disulfide interchange protein DsbA/DsbL [Gammaproteobacteria bacterium]|nr:thiol:disulfide interchange protein DsbA/DsbL [Gammaproteobacteria bacterium]